MPKKRDIRLFLDDILGAISSIRAYTKDMTYEEFADDSKTKDAVVRNLEVIGEAVKNIPQKTKEDYAGVNWKAAAGMRDRLTHEYFGISNQIIWATITNDLPILEAEIRRIAEAEKGKTQGA